MTLSKEKADCGDYVDRISDLPSNVIDDILEHLTIRDVVRTSVLSKKWRYMWITVPRLEFSLDFFDSYNDIKDPGPEVSRIITEILFLHNGPIYKFILRLPSDFQITLECLNKWILFLSRKGVKYILLENFEEPIRMPPHLFSCQVTTYFKLRGFNLSIPPSFCGFKRLMHLQLLHCTFELGALESLVSSCPLLEELYIFRLEGFNLSIPPSFCGFKNLLHLHLCVMTFELGALESLVSSCPLLEELYIFRCSGFECIDLSSSTLKVLDIQNDHAIKSICLEKAKNLIHLTLILDNNCIIDLKKSFLKIQRLTMQLRYKMLCADIIPSSQLINLKYLKLTSLNLDEDERGELLYIVDVLKSASNLVELVIETYYDICRMTQVPDPSEELECRKCCLSQLQKVNIKVGTTFKHGMSLVRFILANSSSLKTLTFEVRSASKKSDAPIISSISRDLLWMKRASQRAQVEFLHQ